MNDNPTIGVILAAGIGSRLRPWTDDRPKALVEVGSDGQTILELLIRNCRYVGIQEILVVTGYCADQVESFLNSWDSPLPVKTCFNPDYATMNNGQSLYVTRKFLGESNIVKFDGDLVLHPEILPRLINGSWRTSIILDDTKVLTDEDLKATIDTATGRVTGLGKWLPNTSNGVSIGIERIDKDDIAFVFDALRSMIHVDGHVDRYYEDAYHNIVGDKLNLGHVTTGHLPWVEIDTDEDLAIGKKLAKEFLTNTKRDSE